MQPAHQVEPPRGLVRRGSARGSVGGGLGQGRRSQVLQPGQGQAGVVLKTRNAVLRQAGDGAIDRKRCEDLVVSLQHRCVKLRSVPDTLGDGRAYCRRGDRAERAGCCAIAHACRGRGAAAAAPTGTSRVSSSIDHGRMIVLAHSRTRARQATYRVSQRYAAAGGARASVARNVHGSHAAGSAATSAGWVNSATRYSNGFSPCSSAV